MTNDMNKCASIEPARVAARAYRPATDVWERDDHFLVVADVPGSRAEDVELRFEQGLLTIHARVAPRREVRPGHEYGVGDWRLSLRFGGQVTADGIDAVYEQGVLRVTLPKAEILQPRKIDVRVN